MNTNNNNNCPSFEELSAYFDSELDQFSLEYAHIQNCDKCQRELDAYTKVSVMLKEELSNSVPDDFSAHMINSLKRRRKRDSSVDVSPFGFFFKVAALLVLSGIIVVALIPHKSNIVQQQVSDTKVAPLIFLDKLTPSGSYTHSQLPPSRRSAAGASDSIDITNMMQVSTGQMGDENLYTSSENKDSVAVIHPKVKQVWSVDSLKHAEMQFAQFAEVAKFATNNSSITMTLKLSKKNLAQFVRNCKEDGFRLLSPSQPQPEQTHFAGNKNDSVLYTATFVQSE